MKKKIMFKLIVILVMIFAINVKANDWSFALVRDGERITHGGIPQNVKSGDIVTIKAIISCGYTGHSLIEGMIGIQYDATAFELINQDDYNSFANNSDFETINITGGSRLSYEKIRKEHVTFEADYENIKYGENEIIEFKFKVLDGIKDGIYTINTIDGYIKISVENNDDYDESVYTIDDDSVFRFQLGEIADQSNYNPDSIKPNTYVIGNYLFTHNVNDEYNGTLTTEYIMLSSKSIESSKKDDMVIYVKNAKGVWKNAITDESITPPSEFEITHIDMKKNSNTNGIYENDDISVRFVELDENSSSVLIENDYVRVQGIASINNGIAKLNINNKNYNIRFTNNKLILETNDEYIHNCELNKKYSYSINDLYEGNKQYLKSEYNGKYVYDDKTLYIYQQNDSMINVRVFDGSNTLLWSYWMYLNSNEEAMIGKYRLLFGNNTITFSTIDGTTAIDGTYNKEKSLNMSEIIKIWNDNMREFAVEFDAGEGINIYDKTFIPEGNKYLYNVDNPIKDGCRFVEWQLDGVKFDFDNTLITRPIVLVAEWQLDIPTPVAFSPMGDQWSYFVDIENVEDYCINHDCNGEISFGETLTIDGYELYEKNGDNYTPLGSFNAGDIDSEACWVTVEPNTKKTFAIRVFINRDNNKTYSEYSEDFVIDNTFSSPTISFATGTPDSPDYVGYENGVFYYDIAVERTCNTVDNNVECVDTIYDKVALYEAGTVAPIKTFEIDSPGEISVPIGETKTYYVKGFTYNSNGEAVYSQKSNELVVDTTLVKPILNAELFGFNGDNDELGYYYYEFTINQNDYGVPNFLNTYIPKYYEIYEKVGTTYQLYDLSILIDGATGPITKFDIDEHVSFVDEIGTSKTFVARVCYSESICSDYSDEITLNWIKPKKPAIEIGTLPVFGENESIVFHLDDSYFYESQEPATEPLFDGASIFKRNGDTYTEIAQNNDIIFPFSTNLEHESERFIELVPGEKNIFVGVLYFVDKNNQKIYSDYSNEIIIDLTNPAYTYELADSDNDNKYLIFTKANNFNFVCQSIIVNDNEYVTQGNNQGLEIDKSVIDNANEIRIKLKDNTEVVATRKTN